MNVPLIYRASSGKEYNLKTDGIRTKTANYHKWTWSAVGTALQYGFRVSNFKRDPAIYTTRLIVTGTTEARKSMLENLHEDFERDIRNQTPGRIIWGDYYIDCYVQTSSTEPDTNPIWTDNEVTFYCPYPFWIEEVTKSFTPQEMPETEFLDYDYDFDYDYAYGNIGSAIWQRDFPFVSEFMMTIFGPVASPRISINGHPYQVNITLDEGEYLTIDSRKHTVTYQPLTGEKQNAFDLRDKVYSVFDPIPGGDIAMNWTGLFGFDLTLYQERSEPRWTT